MSSPNIYTPGGSSGARLATRSPLYMSGRIWYVDTVNGVDAASPAGQSRSAPLKTTLQAYTNASAGDTIQYLAGSSQTIGVSLAASKAGVSFFSEGNAATRMRFTCSAAVSLFACSAAGHWFENISFLAPTLAGSTQIAFTAASGSVVNCSFDCNNLSTVQAVTLGAGSSNTRLAGSTFTSTATSSAARPIGGVLVSSAVSDVELDTVVFDGGTVGWSSQALLTTAAVTRLTGVDCDFINDSDALVATGSTYKFHRRYATGSVNLEFTA